MTDGQRERAGAQREAQRPETEADCPPGPPERDWLGCVADNEDDRRALLRDLLMRALL